MERARCPVDDWTPHDLRRTAATLLADLGCPFEGVEAILAHRLPGVSGTYNRGTYADQKVEWLGKLNAHIDAIAASELLRQLPRRRAGMKEAAKKKPKRRLAQESERKRAIVLALRYLERAPPGRALPR